MSYWLIGAAIACVLGALALPGRVARVLSGGLGLGLLLVALVAGPVFLGGGAWYERSPVRELLLFLLMGLGMVARMLSMAIEERRAARARAEDGRAPSLALDRWDLVYPFLSSAICFGALVEAAGGRDFDLLLAIFAFQNGFFWQTVLAGAKP